MKFWAPELQRGLNPCKPGSAQSFSPGHKAMPRGVPSSSTASPQPDLPWGVHCTCPQLLVLCNSSSPGLPEPSQELSENWTQSQAANLLMSCFSEGLSEIFVGKDLTKLRALAGLGVFSVPSATHSDCQFATMQYISHVFL